jgi:hypothetical protein
MKFESVLTLVTGLFLSASGISAEELVKPGSKERTEGPRDRNLFHVPASFMKTDNVGPRALCFMVGKWHGSVDGELWEEVWSEKDDKTMMMCLRNIQNQAGVVNFEVLVIRGGRHGGTSYLKTLGPLLIEESRDPWMGGVGQESANSAYLALNLHGEDDKVKDSQKFEYTQKSDDFVILKVTRNEKEKVIELHKSGS